MYEVDIKNEQGDTSSYNVKVSDSDISINENDRKKEITELYKHYGNIRFIMLPIFFTAMGAIVVAYWKLSSDTIPDTTLQYIVIGSGVLISLFFCIYEFEISKVLKITSESLPKLDLEHKSTLGLVTISSLLLYAAPIIICIVLLFIKGSENNNSTSFKISSECYESIDVEKITDYQSWVVVAKLKTKVYQELKLFSAKHIGWNVKFIDGYGRKLGVVNIMSEINGSVAIVSSESEKKAKEVKSYIESSSGGCGLG